MFIFLVAAKLKKFPHEVEREMTFADLMDFSAYLSLDNPKYREDLEFEIAREEDERVQAKKLASFFRNMSNKKNVNR